jgi:phosphonopyruvate decarboxylase
VVINNGVHDSVGAQPTVGLAVDLPAIAAACGYRSTRRATSTGELESAMDWLLDQPGPTLLEIRVDPGARDDLGRPTSAPAENKDRLMAFLRRS